MSSLTVTAYHSRRIIKYGGIGLVGLVVVWTLGTALIQAYIKAHPPYIAPTTRFGLLPKIVFPEKEFVKKSFTSELANDTWPTFKDQSKVFVIYRPTDNFLALEYDTKTAVNMGFSEKYTEIRSGVYQFKNDNLNQTLTMNVLNGSFNLEYPYQNDQTLMMPAKVPSVNEATEIARSYLDGIGKYTDDIRDGEKKISFWKIESNELKSVPSQSEANIVRVDFFRKNLDDTFPIISTEYGRAAISVLVSGSSVSGKQVVEINYKYAPIDRNSFSTYPIRTALEAWNEMKAGNYWPVVDTSGSSVVIRKVSLAYMEPITLTNYLQPVFVFEGDNNFVAYVPAILDKWVVTN